MAITLFDPQLVIARLETGVAALKYIGGAADYATALEDAKAKRLPAAYVIDLSGRAAPNGLGTVAVEQRLTLKFGVVIVAQNLRDSRGEQVHADMRTLRIAVVTALLGWKPAAGYDICTYDAGRVLALSDSVLFWQDDFYTALYLRT